MNRRPLCSPVTSKRGEPMQVPARLDLVPVYTAEAGEDGDDDGVEVAVEGLASPSSGSASPGVAAKPISTISAFMKGRSPAISAGVSRSSS